MTFLLVLTDTGTYQSSATLQLAHLLDLLWDMQKPTMEFESQYLRGAVVRRAQAPWLLSWTHVHACIS